MQILHFNWLRYLRTSTRWNRTLINKKIYSEGFASSKEVALIARRVLSQIIANAKELFLYYFIPFLYCRGRHITSAILEKDRALMEKEEEVCN